MNAQQQHSHYSQKIEELISRAEALNAVPATEAYSMTLARQIISDLGLKLDAYGEKAFPMTAKQAALVERGIEEETARLDQREAAMQQIRKSETAAIEVEMQTISTATTEYDNALYILARKVVRGQMTRFEAKEAYADTLQIRDQSAAKLTINRIHDTSTVQMFKAIAEALGHDDYNHTMISWGL